MIIIIFTIIILDVKYMEIIHFWAAVVDESEELSSQ